VEEGLIFIYKDSVQFSFFIYFLHSELNHIFQASCLDIFRRYYLFSYLTMIFLFCFFNSLIDNDFVFYGLFVTTAGFIRYKFVSSYWNYFYVDKGIQIDAWEDYSERPSQLISNSVTSIDTVII
jgi:hypothetical protein